MKEVSFENQFYQVDDARRLYISPVITEWTAVSALGVDTVIDLEG